MAKRAIDVFASGLLILLLSPLMALIYLWISFEQEGPVLFLQQRVGRHGKLFQLFKFRTMRPVENSESEIGVTSSGDSRITRPSGRILRKTKLDELPQLFNILRGDMSFVGPRPELPKFVRHYSKEDKEEVLSVRPGLTCWASLQFADEEAILQSRNDPEQFYVRSILPIKVGLYRDYVRRRSTLYDLKLLAMTVVAMIVPRARQRWKYAGTFDAE